MSEKLGRVIVQVSYPAASSKQGSVIVMTDEEAALRVARIIARETGRGVTVWDSDMVVIETITGASTH